MEIIKNYLENMFMGLPDTEDVRKAKAELTGMMEDKYNELKASGKADHEAIGIVISEFGSLEEVLAELGLDNTKEMGTKPELIRVTLEQAREYMEYCRSASLRIALGIFLCICSPIMLILITGMQEQGLLSIAEDQATFAGLGILFVLVTLGVALMILTGMKGAPYEYLKKEAFVLEKRAEAFVLEEENQARTGEAVRITIGVVLCILSVLPLFAASAFAPLAYQEMVQIGAVGLLLGFVAIGVFLFVFTGIRSDGRKVLLQKEEYAPDRKKDKRIQVVAAIYWPCVTLIYLAWSFLTFNWGFTWIIWPIAGVLFGVIAAVLSVVGGEKKR